MKNILIVMTIVLAIFLAVSFKQIHQRNKQIIVSMQSLKQTQKTMLANSKIIEKIFVKNDK